MFPHRPWSWLLFGLMLGTASVDAAAQSMRGPVARFPSTHAAPAVGRYRLHSVGVWAIFEHLGGDHRQELEPGDIIRQFDQIDPESGMLVSDEVALQMDAMRSIGINIITFSLRTAAQNYDNPGFPQCNTGPATGIYYPAPTSLEIRNLGRFLDLAATKGLRVILRLANTHEDDRAGSATWLDAIFPVVLAHPNVDLVSLDGDFHAIDTDGDGILDACGGVSEPPLFRGFDSPQAQYVKWAIQRAMAAGIAPRLLSAEAIEGVYIYFYQSPISLAGYQDGHAWDPVLVEKQIFDSIGIPDAQRTYDLSFYETTRCGVLKGCVDEPPARWTEEVADRIVQIVGPNSGARILAAEMGVATPPDPSWQSPRAVEHLADVMESRGFDGGAFWAWVSPSQNLENDPATEQDVLKLGWPPVYNPVARNIEDMAGFHLISIPNGSFENGGAVPDHWSVEAPKRRAMSQSGTAPSSAFLPPAFQRIDLSAEAGGVEVPTRGRYALRLATGNPADASIAAVSEAIPVTAGTTYTTAMALRFSWSGDPNVNLAAASRPNVSVSFDYFDSNGARVATRPADVFRYLQEDSTSGFGTFVVHYTPPNGAVAVRIELAAHRNGLRTPIVVDVDALR